MKAIRAILVVGLFFFLGVEAQAQNTIKKVNKNQLQSKQTPKQTPSSYQREAVKPQTTPTPVPPVPIPYPNTTTSSEPKKQEPFKAAPGSSSNGSTIKLAPQQTKAVEQQKKENYRK